MCHLDTYDIWGGGVKTENWDNPCVVQHAVLPSTSTCPVRTTYSWARLGLTQTRQRSDVVKKPLFTFNAWSIRTPLREIGNTEYNVRVHVVY